MAGDNRLRCSDKHKRVLIKMMVCPNCHSHEIISVQGQNFCISCGQIVPDTESEKVLAAVGAQLTVTGQAIIQGHTKPAAAVSQVSAPEKPKKRPVGRPRKIRMDTPITHLPPASPSPTDVPEAPAAKTVKANLPPAPTIAPAKPRIMADVRRPESKAEPEPTAAIPSHSPIGIVPAAWRSLGHGLNYRGTNFTVDHYLRLSPQSR
jgi:hypothetical protein